MHLGWGSGTLSSPRTPAWSGPGETSLSGGFMATAAVEPVYGLAEEEVGRAGGHYSLSSRGAGY